MKTVALTLPFLILGYAGYCAESVQLTCPTHDDLSINVGDRENGQTEVNFSGTLKNTDLTVNGAQRIAVKDPTLVQSFPLASVSKNTLNCLLLFNYTTPESKGELSGAVMMGVNLPTNYKNCRLKDDGGDSVLCETS